MGIFLLIYCLLINNSYLRISERFDGWFSLMKTFPLHLFNKENVLLVLTFNLRQFNVIYDSWLFQTLVVYTHFEDT